MVLKFTWFVKFIYFGLLRDDISIYMSERSRELINLMNNIRNQNWNLKIENNDFRKLDIHPNNFLFLLTFSDDIQ